METMPLAMMKHLEEDVPPVFMILDTYDKDVKVATYLVNLYCNLFMLIAFSIFIFTITYDTAVRVARFVIRVCITSIHQCTFFFIFIVLSLI